MHLDDATLIAWCDRRLTPARSVRVSRHVERCARCRTAADRINRDFRDVLESPPSPPLPDLDEGLAAVLWAAREWQAASRPRAALERRVTADLETYLGAEVAAMVAERAAERGGGLIATARCLLSACLGQDACRALLESSGAGQETGWEAARP